ncbi:MAG: hypothetical protein ACE5KM_19105 [Planctomycetaceae bacterium]
MHVSKPLLLAALVFGSTATFAQERKEGGPSGAAPAKKKKVDLKRVRLFLMDGSVIAGELSVSAFDVTTEFGVLKIPVEKIVGITPGLDSHTKLSAKINKLIADLGDDDYKTREQAHKDLLALGPPVRDVVAEFSNDKNAERKRHATEIVAKIDDMAQEAAEDFDDEEKVKAWVRHDLVRTRDFTVAGRISPNVFEVTTKFGPLKVTLNDIRLTQREYIGKSAISRRLTVPGNSLVQRGMKSSRIRVNVGDVVSVTATGRVAMTNWGSNRTSGPDGSTTYSYYQVGSQRFPGGALVARVGDSGKLIKVGSRAKFTITKAGTLKFGMAMNNSYTSSSYYFPGDYKLRIKVTPKE